MVETIAVPKLLNMGKLNPDTVDKLIQRLRGDLALRKEVIKRLRKNPRAFVEEVFDLTDAERLTLRTAISKEQATAMGQTFITALNNPRVRFTLVREQGTPQVTLEVSLKTIAPSLTAAKRSQGNITQPEVEGEGRIKCRC